MSAVMRVPGGKAARDKEARAILARVEEFKSDSGWDQYVAKLMEYDLQWRGKLARTNKPWEHATDYNTHLTFSKVEDVHAVLFSFFATFNFFKAVPVSSSQGGHDREILRRKGEDQTELMKWSMANESNATGFLDRWIHDGVLYGAGFSQLDYMRDIREIRQEMEVPEGLEDADLSDAKRVIEVTLGANLRSKSIGGNNDAGYTADFVDDDGEEKAGRFWVIDNHPFRQKGELVVIAQREAVMYDAPRSRVIPPWHALVPSHERGLQSAHKYWTIDTFNPDEVRSLASLNVFNALTREDIRQILREDVVLDDRDPEMPIPQGSGTLQLGDDRMDDQRDDTMATPRKNEYREKVTHEVVFEWSFERDRKTGKRVSVVEATFVQPRPILAMKHRVEFLWAHGKRPHQDWHLFPADNRYNGMGVPEVIEGSQREQNALYQARSDILEIITKPGGLYASLSGLSPDEISYFPGMMIRSRNPQTDFRPFDFPVRPEFLFQEQVGHDREAERAIGATDLGLGRQGQANAPRTLGGTAIAVRQQQLRSDVFLRRFMYGRDDLPSGLLEWLHQYRELLGRYMPDEKELLISGRNEIHVFSRQELQGRYVFMVSFDEEINNAQLRATNATVRWQALQGDPQIMQNPQARWHLIQDFMRNTGLPNGPVILPPPTPGDDRPDMTQEQEFSSMIAGVMINPKPTDNHEEHRQAIIALVQDPVALTQRGFTPRTVPLLAEHLRLHDQFMQAQAQVSAGQVGQPGGNGQGNAPLDIQRPTVTLAQTGLGRSEQTDLDQGAFG